MKKTFAVAIAMVFLLRVWVSAERHPGTVDMRLVTNFDFFELPRMQNKQEQLLHPGDPGL
jgi:hypothetical protein